MWIDILRCGTCVSEAKRGEMGFCRRKRKQRRKCKKRRNGKGRKVRKCKRSIKKRRRSKRSTRSKQPNKNPKEFSKPVFDKHWGLCDKQCVHESPRYIIQG